MKNLITCTAIIALSGTALFCKAQIVDPKTVAKNSTENTVNSNIQSSIDDGVGKTAGAIKGLFKKKKKPDNAVAATPTPQASTSTPAVSTNVRRADSSAAFKPYQNYDFIAGEQILFEDHFTDDQNGEFPAHWKLLKGQAVLNKVGDKPSLLLTEGNYAEVAPRMKTDHYLSGEFTVEFDFIFKKAADGTFSDAPGVEFYYKDVAAGYDWPFRVVFGIGDVKIGELTKTYPEDLLNGFENKWHHAAMVYKNGQMKAYVDQFRVCVNPNLENKPFRLLFDGGGSESAPIIFSTVKIANGGGMNMIGKKFTDAKIVTHGINFDIDKSTIKPESMGTLNGIVQILKDNPELKFEVDGHTDNSGGAGHNLALSQQRAAAVKAQLVKMGVEESRLSTKGLGDTKPLSDNATIEGKANNRRVEFVKM
ncbi:OmpA family protein [Mucilaginibacter sp.]|uniref:OmpA family protein n=1 Tax=Mucilaginibacter sp. TaxID=1882438 RepID=UPI0025D45ED9|nr:OmpA family protein [Mucilaginibacter sp.]